MSDERAFKLEIDGDHLGDDDTDASLVKFEGWKDVGGFTDVRPRKLPEHIFFEANTDTLKKIDYPVNDQAWPIMSKRMLEALLSVGDFSHRVIPVIMLDDTVEDKFDAANQPRPGVANHDFAIVQITRYVDAFDWQRSEYVPDELMEGQVLIANKLVLSDVPLPPLFRLSALPGLLLVSAAARNALCKAAIKGVNFISLS